MKDIESKIENIIKKAKKNDPSLIIDVFGKWIIMHSPLNGGKIVNLNGNPAMQSANGRIIDILGHED